MIEFKQPALKDQDWVEGLLARGDERGCEYNFSTLYLWCHAFHVEIAQVEGFFTERAISSSNCANSSRSIRAARPGRTRCATA